MGKRKTETQDNLVMLLDTMCNLLGGLILISILLAVVSQASAILKPQAGPPPTPAVAAALTSQLNTLSNQVIELRRQLQDLGSVTNGPQFNDLTHRIASAESDRIALAKALEAALAEKEDKESALDKWKTERDRLANEWTNLVAQRVTVRAPCAHTTTNRAVFAVLKKGALFAATDVSGPFRAGADRGYDLNAVDVQRMEVAGGPKIHTVTPKEGRGQPIRSGAENGGALHLLLENVNPATEYVYLAVYPDSYQEFNYVKKRIVDKKIGYNWHPLGADEAIKIMLTAGAGTEMNQ